jgi:hypothetical protein
LLRECDKLNGNPFQFNVHDLPPPAYVPKIKEPRPDEGAGLFARKPLCYQREGIVIRFLKDKEAANRGRTVSRFWLTWWRKAHLAGIPQSARTLFSRFRSKPQAARILASCIQFSIMVRHAIEPILGKGDLRRGLMFGLGAFVILFVLILLLVRPITFSPAETIVVSFLILASVVALLVMDLFD